MYGTKHLTGVIKCQHGLMHLRNVIKFFLDQPCSIKTHKCCEPPLLQNIPHGMSEYYVSIYIKYKIKQTQINHFLLNTMASYFF